MSDTEMTYDYDHVSKEHEVTEQEWETNPIKANPCEWILDTPVTTDLESLGLLGYIPKINEIAFITCCNIVYHGKSMLELENAPGLFKAWPVFAEYLMHGDIIIDYGKEQNIDIAFNDIKFIITGRQCFIDPKGNHFDDVEPLLGNKQVIRDVKKYHKLMKQKIVKRKIKVCCICTNFQLTNKKPSDKHG